LKKYEKSHHPICQEKKNPHNMKKDGLAVAKP